MSRTFWNEQSSTYNESWLTRGKSAMSEREMALLTKYGSRPDVRRALDVGIGTGRVLRHHLDATPVRSLFGIDAAEAMVRTCRERFAGESRIEGLAVADLSAPLPFSTEFDTITAIRVLKYDARWADAVRRFSDQLQPGGVLVFSMPNKRSLNLVSKAYGVPWFSTTHGELLDVCAGARLDVLETRGATRLPYGLYERSNGTLGDAMRVTDTALDRILGPVVGVREIFVAARRR